MLILTMRTDRPEAELGLFENEVECESLRWLAHRQLAESIHRQMKTLVERQGKQLADVEGIVVFRGPGSFTGLRIGMSVANALAYGLTVPIVGSDGEDWLQSGIQSLQNGRNDVVVSPVYGSAPHVTAPKH